MKIPCMLAAVAAIATGAQAGGLTWHTTDVFSGSVSQSAYTGAVFAGVSSTTIALPDNWASTPSRFTISPGGFMGGSDSVFHPIGGTATLFKTSSGGSFDLQYATSGAGEFTGGGTSAYTITRPAGLHVTYFEVDSEGYSQGSRTGPTPIIPLPSGAALAGLGLMVVPAIRRRPLNA